MSHHHSNHPTFWALLSVLILEDKEFHDWERSSKPAFIDKSFTASLSRFWAVTTDAIILWHQHNTCPFSEWNTIHGKYFEGEDLSGCAQNRLFTGNLLWCRPLRPSCNIHSKGFKEENFCDWLKNRGSISPPNISITVSVLSLDLIIWTNPPI